MKTSFIPKRKKLGEILVEQGKITPDQLNTLLLKQKEISKPLGQILVEEKHISDEELINILGEQLGIPHVWLRKGLVDPRIVHVLPKEKAIHYQVVPMFRVNNILTLATADPHAYFVFDEVQKTTNLEVQPVLCRADDIREAIHQAYQENVSIDEVMASIDESGIDVVEIRTEREISEIAEMAEGSPVINMTNMILLRGIRDGASDIHIEPQKETFRVRIRIDGVLYDLMNPKIEMHPAVVSRLKVMANLDISERRIPQDGRIQVNAEGRLIDLRFSSMPNIYGEKVVLRILDRSKVVLDINKLGFDPAVLDRFKTLIRRPYGLVLVCGPTGSGKTTTLYSALNMLNSGEKNIVTIEDPVEYQLENVNQSQVMSAIGLSFSKYLKHTLRQDPDIILVGEIRDRETAEIAIQASLTGHLVFSTLHTNDSPSAITRLLEMRVEPYLISSALLACLAQRLVRTICPECKTDYYASKSVLKELNIEEDKKLRLSEGKGCSACFDSGFKGRTGIHEMMEISEGLQSLILENPSIDMIQKYLSKNGQKRLKELGYEKVLNGDTTMEEVRRATSMDT
ncbi:MAG: Flp pilus assembly complex ATPase component TadA [Deltaproteobacteria bacterium]|nr:Flp pilus assembly complex ATPase component TadA [Deltaproteobacteria bacterium]MBW2143552.1 Flp pilus assembly complex ATPase component TadA [Deltaproteobacteria bacterium]